MIRRYIIWRNNHAYDERLRQVADWQTLPDGALHSASTNNDSAY